MEDKSSARIHRVVAALSHLVTAEEVAGAVVREVASALGACAARVGLYDPEGISQPVSSFGYPAELTARWAVRRLVDSPMMQEVRSGKAVFARRCSEDPRVDQSLARCFDDGAVLVVPMAVADKVIGHLSAAFDHPRDFDTEEREFILTLVAHCGQSLERARLFEAERRARRKLDAVLTQLPVAVAIVDKDGHTVLNDQVRAIYGITLRTANLNDYPSSGRKHLDGREYSDAELPVARALAGEQIRSEVLQIDRPDGTLRTVSVNAAPVRDDQGGITSAVAAFSDVTDELRIANQLRASERRYHAVLRATNDVIWEFDPATGHVVWNAELERVFGHSREDASQHPQGGRGWWQEHLHPDDRAAIVESFQQALQSGASSWIGEYRLCCGDGSYVNTLDRCVLERDDSGKVIRAVGAMSDITDRQRLLNELRDAISVRDDFLSIAGHELRNPLAALSAQLAGLELMPLDEAQRANKLGAAKRQVRRLSTLVDELLNVSRIVHGRLRLERETTDLARLVVEAADRLADDFARGGTPLEVEAPGPLTGSWDRLRLDLVFSNLLSNALRYGQKQPVRVRVETDPTIARVIVEDRGIGIRPEYQARIFERFVRAVPAREYGGLGVGLWLSRQIVEAHEGRLRVESREGEGSRFTVELPR
jgi:PAS domain S-box-containing protein